jgi:hypothetical protein
MRKYILFFTFCFLSSYNAYSKGYAYGGNARIGSGDFEPMKFGINAGTGIWSRKVGLFYEYRLENGFGARAGVNYYKDSYFWGRGENFSDSDALNAKFLSLPIYLKGYFSEAGKHCLYLELLPCFLMSSSGSSDANDPTAKAKYPEPSKFAFAMGAGYEYEFNFGAFIGLSYRHMLKTLVKDSADNKLIGNFSFNADLGFNVAKLLV